MIDLAKKALAEGDCTLAVAKDGRVWKFHQRGVADLASLLDTDPSLLRGACIADKVVGKAAAALMIAGGASQVYSRVMTRDALAMFAAAGIPATCGQQVEMVENRAKTGRCPIDTLCAPLTTIPAMLAAIRAFLNR